MAKKPKHRGRGITKSAIRLLQDESGRMPLDLSKVQLSTTLPDWYFEPKAFRTRVKARSMKRLRPIVGAGLALALLEDGRQFSPAPYLPKSIDGRSAGRISVSPPRTRRRVRARPLSVKTLAGIPVGLRFANPLKVVLCVRRTTRREVLFAKKRAGRNGQRTARRTFYSLIGC